MPKDNCQKIDLACKQDNDRMRCFIALSLPVPVKNQLSKVQRCIRNLNGLRVSFPPSKNLHITLAFLGSIGCETKELLVSSMETVAHEFCPFPLGLSQLGTFPVKSRSPKVLWAGVNGDLESIKKLHSKLNSELATKELPFNQHKFSPHITLARIKHKPSNGSLLKLETLTKGAFESVESKTFQVRGMSLYHSKLTPQGAVHTEIHRSQFRRDSNFSA